MHMILGTKLTDIIIFVYEIYLNAQVITAAWL